MKLKFEKKRCNSAIVMLNGRLNLTTTDMIAVELDYIKQLLENTYDRKVTYVSHKTRKDKDNPSYKDIDEVNLNDYDEVFIYNSSLNLFGGVFSLACLKTFKQLVTYKGQIYYILSDPRFPCRNFAELIYSKLVKGNGSLKTDGKEHTANFITFDDCKKYTNDIFPNIITAFNGFDYDLYCNLYAQKHKKMTTSYTLPQKQKWCEFTFFQFFGKKMIDDKQLQQDYSFDSRKYDLCYYGINRRNERNKIIADLYSSNKLKKLFIGFDGIQLPNTDRIERVQREDLFSTIAKNSIATIVIGDDFHNNNCITFRFYEAMLLDCVALIYDKFDTNRKLVNDKTLQEFIYVKSTEDVEDRLLKLRNNEKLFRKIVALQRAEIYRLLANYNI